MHAKVIAESELGRRFVLAFDRGDELMATVREFAERERLRAAEFTAIGAVESATLAYFDVETREYVELPDPGQSEVVSMNGRITLPRDADPDDPPPQRQLHVHCVLSRRDGSTIAGHVMDATIRPTLELFIAESRAHLTRREDPDSGLPVISLEAE
jgi:predicted DNA-binding protein with PD1-like motif